MKFEYAEGATPIDPDEAEGLIPNHITTQSQLNEWEASNILKAENWLSSTPSHGNFLTLEFVKLLHKKMFDDTWKWAGLFRTTLKSVGPESFNISPELKILLDNVRYQITNINPNDKQYNHQIDEILYRFHHRLVFIHPFSNGNGRHSRLMTDFILVQAGRPRFTWGRENLIKEGPTRKKYIDALRKADKHDYSELATFVRS